MKAQATPAAKSAKQAPVVHIKLTAPILTKLEEGVEKTGINKSALSRLALERGLEVVLSQLNPDPTPPAKHAA